MRRRSSAKAPLSHMEPSVRSAVGFKHVNTVTDDEREALLVSSIREPERPKPA